MFKRVVEVLRKRHSDTDEDVFFDVGANTGQTVKLFTRVFPRAKIHAFEPAPVSLKSLQDNCAGLPNVIVNGFGLGDRNKTAKLLAHAGTGSHLLPDSETTETDYSETRIVTGETYCRENDIKRIRYLKVDTEGFDLEVLVGFHEMLLSRSIDYLQVECTTNLDNRFHAHLERFIHFLHPFNYRLMDLIDPVYNIHATSQSLNGIWYCNAVFALEEVDPKLRRDGRN